MIDGEMWLSQIAQELGTSNRTVLEVCNALNLRGRRESHPAGRGGSVTLYTPDQIARIKAGMAARRERARQFASQRTVPDDDNARRALILVWVEGTSIRDAAHECRVSQRVLTHTLACPPPFNGLPDSQCSACGENLAAHDRCWACSILLHGDGVQRDGWNGPLCRSCGTPRARRVQVRGSALPCPAVHDGRVCGGV